MSSRGRGGGRGRATLPNLASAGKKEAAGQSDGAPTRKRGGPRGRGRVEKGSRRGGNAADRGGHRSKPELIQTMGVFSDGLHALDKKNERVKLEVVPEVRRPLSNDVPSDAQHDDRSKTATKGYTELWASDDELDQAELSSLLHDAFISNCRRGLVLPLVTPCEHSPQFQRLIKTDVKSEIMDTDTKDDIIMKGEEYKCAQTSEAFEVFKRLQNEKSDDFVALQLPSALLVMTSLCDDKAPSTLPRGRFVGKMRALTSGKLVLSIGPYNFDVTKCNETGYHEELISICTAGQNACSSLEQSTSSGGLAALTSAVRLRSEAGNIKSTLVYHGPIKHHMSVSINFTNELRHSERQENEIKKAAHLPSSHPSTLPSSRRSELSAQWESVTSKRRERGKALSKC